MFNGLIDELSVTLITLPADEIARIYANAGIGTDLGGGGTEGTTVAGNWIGTNALAPPPWAIPATACTSIRRRATRSAGPSPAAANLISGNANGVEINDASQDSSRGT